MQNVKQCIHAEQARWRVWFWAACELFVLFSMMRSLRIGPMSDALVCLLVGIGVLVPYVLETWGCRVSNALLVFSMLYLLGGMSGRIYKLYYLIAHWDKLLHYSGAVVYAVVFALDRGRHPAFTRVVPSASQAEAAHAHVC